MQKRENSRYTILGEIGDECGNLYLVSLACEMAESTAIPAEADVDSLDEAPAVIGAAPGTPAAAGPPLK